MYAYEVEDDEDEDDDDGNGHIGFGFSGLGAVRGSSLGVTFDTADLGEGEAAEHEEQDLDDEYDDDMEPFFAGRLHGASLTYMDGSGQRGGSRLGLRSLPQTGARGPASSLTVGGGRGKVKGALLAAAAAASSSLADGDMDDRGSSDGDGSGSAASTWSGSGGEADGAGSSASAASQEDPLLTASQQRALPVMERLARMSKSYEQHQQYVTLRALHAQQSGAAGAGADLHSAAASALEGSLAEMSAAPPALQDVLDTLATALSPAPADIAAGGPDLCPAGVARALLGSGEGLLRGLRDGFAAADAAGDEAVLFKIGALAVSLLMLNDAALLDTLVDDDFFAFLVGSLEREAPLRRLTLSSLLPFRSCFMLLPPPSPPPIHVS